MAMAVISAIGSPRSSEGYAKPQAGGLQQATSIGRPDCIFYGQGGGDERPGNDGAMADDLTFLMGKFPAVLPGDLRYAPQPHVVPAERGPAVASASRPTPSG